MSSGSRALPGYEADKKRRLGVDADQPHRINYKRFARADAALTRNKHECDRRTGAPCGVKLWHGPAAIFAGQTLTGNPLPAVALNLFIPLSE